MLDPEEALQNLDNEIRRLKIDFDRFFNGAAAVPPEQLRSRIRSHIQELRSVHLRTVALRFRLNNLEARFNTLSVLFNRRLRLREQGWLGGPGIETGTTEPDPREGVIIDHHPSSEVIRSLFVELYGESDRQAKADFERFETYLLKQAQRIRKKTGCSRILFRVASESGRVKLKAKPI